MSKSWIFNQRLKGDNDLYPLALAVWYLLNLAEIVSAQAFSESTREEKIKFLGPIGNQVVKLFIFNSFFEESQLVRIKIEEAKTLESVEGLAHALVAFADQAGGDELLTNIEQHAIQLKQRFVSRFQD